ncbi:DNA polymerase III subunit beta [Elongatibacter sediminis]|uniref:Beta sliding clamp n=1 Tax=Elongatibacter sediminis TaxID=3119006 RepID=A0AAW9RA20_9GAMM
MKFSIKRETFLHPLSQVIGVVERRQTLPVLANFLIQAKSEGQLAVTGTDMEVELIANGEAEVAQEGEVTVPARKLLDIVRMLPDGVAINVSLDGDKLMLSSGRSRFTLATLPATEFPATDQVESLESVELEEKALKRLLDKTSFAMANQDVRYYLNGLLFEFKDGQLRTVATDGHRLAVCDLDGKVEVSQDRQMIVPRKGVLELARMLTDTSDPVSLGLGKNHVRLVKAGLVLTSKLIDGRFPDYQAVVPVGTERNMTVDRGDLIHALQRASILSNEKYKGVRLEAGGDVIKIIAHNPQHEEAEEVLEAELDFEQMAVGFNVTYLLDALNALESERVALDMRDANSSCLITALGESLDRHVVMPLKL